MEADYHVSPILAPSELLAEFPPLLLQCGGRDPLVDDTVLFAARVRQAKLSAHGKAAAAATTGATALNGDAVHPARPTDGGHGHGHAYAYDAYARASAGADVDANESVKMQIFPGWSHGYLQMSSIMREARVAIDDIANWIQGTFEQQQLQQGFGSGASTGHHTATKTTVAAAAAMVSASSP